MQDRLCSQYEDLELWQASADLALAVKQALGDAAFAGSGTTALVTAAEIPATLATAYSLPEAEIIDHIGKAMEKLILLEHLLMLLDCHTVAPALDALKAEFATLLEDDYGDFDDD
ncbi:MAG: hypothetical protein RIM72_20985 [Alphaproteobacteria bacterium]